MAHSAKRLTAALVMALAASGCTSEDQASRALRGAGYRDVQFTGYAIFGCAENDTFHTGFSARGPDGTKVTGVVCSSPFKGATIRTD